MNLYTIIFDYKGGTYIEQIPAKNVSQAVILWAKNLNPKNIYGMGKYKKQKLIAYLEENLPFSPPVLLNGLENCWCVSSFSKGCIHVVKTQI